MTGKKRHLFCGMIFIVLLIADRYTKYLAVIHLKGNPAVSLIRGVLELTYVENHGAAFGMLQNARVFFIIITFIVIVFLLYVMLKMPQEKKYFFAFFICTLVITGAVGNLIDRMTTVYVVDFIYFSLIDFPVFNMADIYVTVSMFAAIALALLYYKEDDFAFLNPPRKED